MFWIALMLALLALVGFLALRGTGALAAIPAFVGVAIVWLMRHGGGFVLGRLLSGLLGRAAPRATGMPGRPAAWSSARAFRVALARGTLPPTVVNAKTSACRAARAIRMAMASSTPGSVSRMRRSGASRL